MGGRSHSDALSRGGEHTPTRATTLQPTAPISGAVGSGPGPEPASPDPSAQEPARRGAGRALGAGLLGDDRPHIGGLRALGPLRHVELDGLRLIKRVASPGVRVLGVERSWSRAWTERRGPSQEACTPVPRVAGPAPRTRAGLRRPRRDSWSLGAQRPRPLANTARRRVKGSLLRIGEGLLRTRSTSGWPSWSAVPRPSCCSCTRSASTTPGSCWSLPGSVPSGCVARQPSRTCAGPRRSPPARAPPTGTGCTAAVTAARTGRCTWPWSFACAGGLAPAATPSDAPSRACPSRRSSGASNATSPARSTTPWSPTSRPSTRLRGCASRAE
jgi:hypothetical protein